MPRAGIVRTAVVVLVCCLLAGCSAAGRVRPMALFGRGESPENQSEEKTAEANPFRPTSSRDDQNDGDAPASDDSGAITHDRETLELIARELQDADPEERQLLLDSLKGLTPEMVRNILKARRMRIQLEQNRQRLAQGETKNSDRGYHGLGAPFPGTERPEHRRDGVEPAGYSSTDSPETTSNNGPLPQIQPSGRDRQSGHAGTEAFGHSSKKPAAVEEIARRENSDPLDPAAAWAQPNDSAAAVSANGSSQSRQRSTDSGPTIRPGPQSQGPGGTGQRGEEPVGLGRPQFAEGAGQPSAWQGDLQRLIGTAEEQARQVQERWEQHESAATNGGDPQQAVRLKQEHVRQQVYLRLLYLMAGHDAQALDSIPGLDAADQEFWTQMLWAIMNYFDYSGIPQPEDRATQAVAQLRSAMWRLQEKARLNIRNVNFCKNISSYGNYETFPQDEFRRKQAVLIYAEIENFASEQGTDGMYRTQLKSTIEIHRAGPQEGLVKRIEFPATTDLCRNHRRDYFHSYEIQIPADATLGPHVLKVIVEDELSRKVASYSRNFMVVDGR